MTQAGEAARHWHRLSWHLQLLGAEERRWPALRAFRDPARTRVYDRHIVLAAGPPGDVEAEVRALDAWYHEGRAQNWSLVVLDGDLAHAWEEALRPKGCAAEWFLIHEGLPRGDAPPPEIVRLEGRDGFARLRGFSEEVAGLTLGDGSFAWPVLELLAARKEHGFPSGALALFEAGQVVGDLAFTVARDRIWMEDLQVHPRMLRRGLGRALFRAALAEAQALGASTIGFAAAEADWTWRWYGREGFPVIGRYLRLRRPL